MEQGKKIYKSEWLEEKEGNECREESRQRNDWNALLSSLEVGRSHRATGVHTLLVSCQGQGVQCLGEKRRRA